MQSKATTVDQYIDELPDDRKKAMTELRKVIKKNIPKGFQETMGYGNAGYVVPHSKYPAGYHCDPTLPLPFMGFASQKNFIAVYHMGIYADPKLLKMVHGGPCQSISQKAGYGQELSALQKAGRHPL